MKKILLLLLISSPAFAGTAYFSHETAGSGMTKQCHYRYLNETYTITVSKTKICPITIQV